MGPDALYHILKTRSSESNRTLPPYMYTPPPSVSHGLSASRTGGPCLTGRCGCLCTFEEAATTASSMNSCFVLPMSSMGLLTGLAPQEPLLA